MSTIENKKSNESMGLFKLISNTDWMIGSILPLQDVIVDNITKYIIWNATFS